MAVTWAAGSFENGANLNTIRTNINNFNDEVSIAIASSNSTISSVNLNVSTNTANIATNTAAIGTNAAAIAANTSLINTRAPFEPSYDYLILPATTVTATAAGTQLTLLTTPSRPTGTYKLAMSTIYSYASVTDDVHFRFRLQGGVWSPTISVEPKDISNSSVLSYTSTHLHTSEGPITVEIEAWSDNASHTFEIKALDIAVERVV